MARRWSLALEDTRLSLDVVGLLPDPVPGQDVFQIGA